MTDKQCSGERVGGGDNDSYCDSEASLDDGSCYDNLEDAASPPPSDLNHPTLDLRHQDVSLRVIVAKILRNKNTLMLNRMIQLVIIIILWLFPHLIIFNQILLISCT